MQQESWTEGDLKQVIELGAIMCSRIKKLRPNHTWMQVAGLFTAVKHYGRKFFPDMKEIEFLRNLNVNFSNQDIEDALNGNSTSGKDANKSTHQQKNAASTTARATERIASSFEESKESRSGTYQSREANHRPSIDTRI